MKGFLLRLLLALVAVVLIGVAWIAITLGRAGNEPSPWAGEYAFGGLESPVTITRDDNGIPFIQASSEHDLYFAQGFVHAQDRFWQMALSRQGMRGRLAEWLGSLALRNDLIARMWNWPDQARRSFEALSAADRALLEAYADGVNAWLDSPAYRRPPEMVILHIQPEPWLAEDAFMVNYAMNRVLLSPGNEGFLPDRFRQPGAPSQALEILDDSGFEAPPIVPMAGGDPVARGTMPFKQRAFSDNWTLSGDHTVTGLPLMANDPQLAMSHPGTWQLQHHTLDGRRMAGGTLPGIPGIVVGHNGHLAWGITNAVIDSMDIAFLQLDPEDPSLYRRSPESAPDTFEVREETIVVRWGRDRAERFRSTPKGVVWPRGLAFPNVEGAPDRGFELREAAIDLPTQTPVSFVHLNRARDVAEGMAALEGLVVPALNISLADEHGTIGYVMAGRIAVRPEAHATRIGMAPDDDNDREYLPFSANPRVVDPPGGRIVTANQQIVGDGFPHYLTDAWAQPWRAWRIHELLDEQPRHDAESFRAMQMDALSPVARALVPLMLETTPADEADAALLQRLRDWDHRFTLASSAPVIWLTWFNALQRSLFEDDLGPVPYGLLYLPAHRALSGEHPQWCDDTRTEAEESCADQLRSSLSQARAQLEEAFGPDPGDWAWGEVAQFSVPHLGFAGLPLLDARFSRRTPLPGGPESLFINGITPTQAPRFLSSNFNSSYQAIYDLSDLDRSLFMTADGPSGHFRSEYYDNLTGQWISGQRIALDADDMTSTARLTLSPPD